MKNTLTTTLKKTALCALSLVALLAFSLAGFSGATVAAHASETAVDTVADNPKIFSSNEMVLPDNTDEMMFPDTSDDAAIAPRFIPEERIVERVDFATRWQDGFAIPDATPAWISPYSCGITAGAVALGYFNRRVPNLIENQVAGRYILGRWVWNSEGDGARALFSDLFLRMGATDVGVTMEGYLNGMRSYVASRGRHIAFAELRTGHNQLNELMIKSFLRSGLLVTLFVSGYSTVPLVGGVQTFDNHDIIHHYVSQENHVMIAYGYRRVRYYDAAGRLIRNDLYLYVHSGFRSSVHRLVPLYRFGFVYNAFTTHVF